MKNIKDNYIVIQGWMVQDLNLSGNELMTFALIYGFCQDNESEFTGSINYVCTWLNCTRPTAAKALKGLTDKGLIIKNVVNLNGVQFNRYKINIEGVKNLYRGSKESLHGGSKESLPNNIINNTTINNDRVEPTPEILENKNEIFLVETEEERKKVAAKKENKIQPQKFKVPKYESVSFTLEQMRALEERFGSDTEWIIKTLHNYKMSSGKKYKSDYHAIFTWVLDKYNKEKKPQKIGSMDVSNMPKYDFENIPDPLKDFR
jgi:hypothetical protein